MSWTSDYLSLVVKYGVRRTLTVVLDAKPEVRPQYEEALKCVQDAAGLMAVHGYPEASDRALTHSHDGIIPRILAIRNGGGVCYNVHNLAGVMNAIKNLGDSWRNDHSIYLIAEKAFWGESGLKTEWFTYWTAKVREAIKQRDDRYLRDGKYDELLSLLFPELRPGLSHGFGRRLEQKQQSNGRIPNLQVNVTEWGGSENDDGWLKGWALKEWLRKHPGWPRQ